MTLQAKATPIMTGGAVMLDMTVNSRITPSGSLAISRAVSGASGLGPFTLIFSGAPIPYFPDVGEMLPGPLNAASGYVYRVADVNGSIDVGPVYPVGQVLIEPDGMTERLIRLFQAGIDNIPNPPERINSATGLPYRPQVLQAMPMTGEVPLLPVIVVNLDLIQPTSVPIGQQTPRVAPGNPLTVTIECFARRVWTISILADNPVSRDFWRNSVAAIFQSLLSDFFQPLGRNLSHRFEIASGQMQDERKGLSPGFYFADCMIIVEGVFSTVLSVSYGLIETIAVSGIITGMGSGAIEALQVPNMNASG